MAGRKSLPSISTEARLSPEKMRAAIPKLERRIKDLEEFEPESLVQRDDPRLAVLERKIEDTIAGIFGQETAEFARFRPRELDQAPYNYLHDTPLLEVIKSVEDSKVRELLNISTIIELFNENLGDEPESPLTKARRTFGDLDLHPEIANACSKLFSDGHYTQSVENACKVLELLVKMRSLRSEIGGTDLMQQVFSPKAPILRFSDLVTESEKSEQQGMMFLFSGVMLAIRNPRAHGLLDDHPAHAIDCISFISMLAKSLDRTHNA